MLATLDDVLRYAADGQCAAGAFNTPDLECMRAVLLAAEELGVPVILSHAQIHEPVAPLEVVGPIMVLMAKRASVPVCVHLDHCEAIPYARRALEMGFTGVMYDGSTLSYEQNAENTRAATELAHSFGAGVEGEIGALPSREDGAHVASGPVYTDPALAARFARETGIDALAPSFGTVHGIYRAEPKLDLELLAEIRRATGLPLVMHGGSGVSAADFRTAIRNGVRKINYYSYMAREGVYAARRLLNERDVTYYHDVAAAATEAMRRNALEALKLFRGE